MASAPGSTRWRPSRADDPRGRVPAGPPGAVPAVLIVGERPRFGPRSSRPSPPGGRAGGRAAGDRRGGLGRPPHRQRRLVLRPAPCRPGGVRRPPRGRAVEVPPRRGLDLPRRRRPLGQGGDVRRRARPGNRRRHREFAPDRSSPVRGRRPSALAEVPGLLAVGDLPQIAGLIAPRPCRLASPILAPTTGRAPPTAPSAPTASRSRRRNPIDPHPLARS